MAVRIAHPLAFAKGVYHLNVRGPADIAATGKGAQEVTVPIAGKGTIVRISDKVVVSLRTKDPHRANDRFTQAHAALARHWQMVRVGPLRSHKQAVAVAGIFYRQQVAAQG